MNDWIVLKRVIAGDITTTIKFLPQMTSKPTKRFPHVFFIYRSSFKIYLTKNLFNQNLTIALFQSKLSKLFF